MAENKKNTYDKGVVPRGDEFQSNLKLKGETLKFIRETLEKTTEEAFSDGGFPQADKPAGFYSNDRAWGMGAATSHFNVKIGGQTQSFMEKQISFGGKRMFVEVHIAIHPTSQTMEIKYKTTEASAFRGYHSSVGPMMINEQLNFDLKNMDKFKKDFTAKMKEFAKKEAAYMASTKLGTEDPIEKSTASMVESKGMSVNDVFFSSDEEFLRKMNETSAAKLFEIVDEEEKKKDELLLSDREVAEEEEDKTNEIPRPELGREPSGASSTTPLSESQPSAPLPTRNTARESARRSPRVIGAPPWRRAPMASGRSFRRKR